ncbi:MAG: tetratricopeptide repeat protein [Chthoniobacterales bacterium]
MKSLLAELKRRNVYKVAVAYAVVAWLLLQALSILLPAFEAPAWVMKVFIAAIAAGFPLALIFAWAFELTPEGIKRTDEVPVNQSIAHTTGWKLLAIVTVLAVIAAALLVFQLTRRNPPANTRSAIAPVNAPTPAAAPAIPAKSIAVLPFASLSEDKANTYFADGIQDEILTRLSKIGELKVISRTSTQQYQSKPGNVAEIAKQLGVAHILEGSVQKAGESVRVNVQLIKAEGDSHLWAETYDRKLTDIFGVETEVAQRIASSLEAKLTGHEKEAINYIGTKIPAAYDAYLRGIALRNSQSREDQDRLIQYCRKAVALDPNYAVAWTNIAVAEGLKYIQGERTEAQSALVKEAAENALRLDPEHGSGHAAMGMYLYYCLQEYDKALVELQQARQQAPNDPLMLQAVGLVKRRQGKLDESIELQLQAAQIDPLNQDIWVNLGWSYRGMRRFADARAMFDRALSIAPNERSILGRKAESYLAEGDLATASRLIEEFGPQPAWEVYFGRIAILVFQRKLDEAIAKITADLEKAESPPPFVLAAAHLTLGALHAKAGRSDQAQPFLLKADAELTAFKQQGNISPDVLRLTLEVHALLGRRQEVKREAADHIARQAKDRWSGPEAEADAARAYSILCDRDRAISILERLLVQPSSDALTPAYLRMDPIWDPIRDDPRFQRLANGTR